jgi:IS5 family transposase
VADSISWRRFCRIGLHRPVPHPTTLVKLVRRAGPNTVEQLNSALLGKLGEDKLLPGQTNGLNHDIDGSRLRNRSTSRARSWLVAWSLGHRPASKRRLRGPASAG